MYKGILSLLLALLTASAFLMTACDNSTDTNGSSSDSAEYDLSFEAGYDDQPFYLSRSDMLVTDGSGYYQFYGSTLYYYDSASGQYVVVCSKPDCKHITDVDEGDSDCNAFFPNTTFYNDKGYAYYDESIYLLGKSSGDDAKSVSLYKISKDGSEREEVCKLFSTSDINTVGCFTVHRGYAFWTLFPEGSTQIYSMKLDDTDSITTVYESEGYAPYILGLTGSGDYMYFEYEDSTDETYEEFTSTMYRVKLGTGEVEEILEIDNGDVVVVGSKIYYLSGGQYLYSYDMEDKTTTELYELTNSEALLLSDNEYLYLSNWDNVADSDEYVVNVLTFDGELVDSLEISDCDFLIGGDSNNLFIDTTSRQLSVFDKSQIGTGEHQWSAVHTFS